MRLHRTSLLNIPSYKYIKTKHDPLAATLHRPCMFARGLQLIRRPWPLRLKASKLAQKFTGTLGGEFSRVVKLNEFRFREKGARNHIDAMVSRSYEGSSERDIKRTKGMKRDLPETRFWGPSELTTRELFGSIDTRASTRT
jgi:hypothetical protein